LIFYLAAPVLGLVVQPNIIAAYALFAFGVFWVYLFLSGLIWGSGWSPTPERQLRAAADLLDLKEGDVVYDLGSGFGRAEIFFAREIGARPVGVEIDPLRRLVTRWSARRHGLDVGVMGGNLLDADLSEARKVFVFLTPLIMRRLQEKLQKELPRGALVASVEHRFPDWTEAASIEDVHLYVASSPQTVRPQANLG
jgi:SAM-dependent methyltransferase